MATQEQKILATADRQISQAKALQEEADTLLDKYKAAVAEKKIEVAGFKINKPLAVGAALATGLFFLYRKMRRQQKKSKT